MTGARRVDAAAALIDDPSNDLWFSVASLCEIVIKSAHHGGFRIHAGLLRKGVLDNGWRELPVESAHVQAVAALPPLHKDPFDRLLIAQATVEGALLPTSDAAVADYPGPIRKV